MSLLLSALVAWVGAYVNSQNQDLFFDSEGNEVPLGGDTTLLLVVIGIILAINGLGVLVASRRG